jgi:hypothetical protein
MVKAPPSPSFIVAYAEFLLQFLVVPFNNPPMLGPIDELLERRIFWQCG